MSEPNNGGPAFPAPNMEWDDGGYGAGARWIPKWGNLEGMTLRDYFAAKAMQSLMHPEVSAEDMESIYETSSVSEAAYGMADAMLRERSKP